MCLSAGVYKWNVSISESDSTYEGGRPTSRFRRSHVLTCTHIKRNEAKPSSYATYLGHQQVIKGQDTLTGAGATPSKLKSFVLVQQTTFQNNSETCAAIGDPHLGWLWLGRARVGAALGSKLDREICEGLSNAILTIPSIMGMMHARYNAQTLQHVDDVVDSAALHAEGGCHLVNADELR